MLTATPENPQRCTAGTNEFVVEYVEEVLRFPEGTLTVFDFREPYREDVPLISSPFNIGYPRI